MNREFKSRTQVYNSWVNMKQRCNNLNAVNYENYGGRGITYDPSWERFETFYADMGECPIDKTLDRKDNNKGYNKENCRWATQSEQQRNKRNFKNNKTGIKGVHKSIRNVFVALGYKDGVRYHLYQGPDFFEAACARKSWENSYVKSNHPHPALHTPRSECLTNGTIWHRQDSLHRHIG